MTRPPVEVAVGVLSRPDGRVLLASRPEGKPYAGYWEFPGGKVEDGETIARALTRELHEELAIDIEDPRPWFTIEHVYPHAHVRLNFTRVTRWQGELHAHEGQQFGWFDIASQLPHPVLPATIPCLRWLTLPTVMGVSYFGDDPPTEASIDRFLLRLEHALAKGLRMVQLRAPSIEGAMFERLFEEMSARVSSAGARLVVNSRHPLQYAHRAGGLHLRSEALHAIRSRPAIDWVGASVHTREEIGHAASIGLDYVVLGTVQSTATHPDANVLGWSGFEAMTRRAPLPVFAIGGLSPIDLEPAQIAGAHGIALMRAAWR